MSIDTTALTPVDEFTADLYPPRTGTPINSADVASGEQTLLNRTEYLYNHAAAHTAVFGDGDFGAATVEINHWHGGGTSYEDGDVPVYVDVAGCLVDDLLVIAFSGNFEIDHSLGADGYDRAAILVVEDVSGTPVNQGTNGYASMYAAIVDGVRRLGGQSIATVSHAIVYAGTARVKLQVIRPNSLNDVKLRGGYSFTVIRVRP